MSRSRRILSLAMLPLVCTAFVCACLFVNGLAIPFCDQRTNGIERISRLPPQDALVAHFENGGWQLNFNDFAKLDKDTGLWTRLFEASREFDYWLLRPKSYVYIAEFAPDFGGDDDGHIQIIIENGNRLANQRIYESVVEQLNEAFDLDVGTNSFSYDNVCS